jgi:hypothetical protein
MKGNAIAGERVVLVQVDSGRVNLKRGRVCDVRADDPGTVQLDGRQFDQPAESYDQSFRADDIHLLREQEAKSLQEENAAFSWFGPVYQDRVVKKIQLALKRFKLA